MEQILCTTAVRQRPSFEIGAPRAVPSLRPVWLDSQPRSGADASPRWEQSSNLLGLVLNQIDYGLALVTSHGRVSFANRAARQEVARNTVIGMQDGYLVPRNDDQKETLAAALKAARAGRRTLLMLRHEQERQSLATIPLGAGPDGGSDGPVLLVLGRRTLCEKPTLDFFACAHRLTPAEASVLKGVCDGLRPDKIAERTNVAISTVRSQIGSIRSKTATSSIAELVNTMIGLPPIVPAALELD